MDQLAGLSPGLSLLYIMPFADHPFYLYLYNYHDERGESGTVVINFLSYCRSPFDLDDHSIVLFSTRNICKPAKDVGFSVRQP